MREPAEMRGSRMRNPIDTIHRRNGPEEIVTA